MIRLKGVGSHQTTAIHIISTNEMKEKREQRFA